MNYNKPWLQGQLHDVFTPRTLFHHRKDIIDQFRKVMGEIDPNLSVDSSDSSELPPEMKKEKRSEMMETLRKSQNAPRGLLEAGIGEKAAEIAKYWLTRMRFIHVLRVQTQSIMELNLQEKCIYCGTKYGLSCELIQNIEDMFRSFVKDTKQTMPDYNFQQWILYFRARAQYRTLCFDCSEIIIDYHQKLKRLKRMNN